MAAQLYYSPFIPAFSPNGLPVPGAKLFFFFSGTDTLAPIFTTDALTTRSVNPVVADLAGRFAPVYLDSGTTYRVRLVDPDGIQLGDDLDPYIPGQALKGPAGPAGAANSTYTSLAALKNAPVSNGTYSLLTSGGRTEYAYVPGNFTGLADDVLVIPLNGVPVTTGALIATGSISPSTFGASVGIADNSSAFSKMLSVCRYLAVNYAIPPRVDFPSGTYKYSGIDQNGQPLNWAVQGLTILAQPGVILLHTGSGRAFNVDGGATGGGVAMMRILGGIVVRGNINTTDGVYNRAIHHSTFDIEVQSVGNYGLLTEWAVCNEYRFRCSPLFRPAFSPVPIGGMFLSSRGTGEATSRCNFYNPILEGINGYGININDGIINTFLGGTSESNVGGIFLGPKAVGNIIDGLDLEFNTVADVFNQGLYNTFRDLLSDSFSSFGGFFNTIRGGLFNSITNNGVHNTLEYLSFSTAGGTLTDTGTETEYSSVRNATSNTFLPDRRDRTLGRMQVGNLGAGLVMGRADMVDGGSAANVALAIQGSARAYLRSDAGLLLGWNNTGLGFYDKAATPVGKPNVSGAKGGNAALGSLLGALSSLGLIVDSTTA